MGTVTTNNIIDTETRVVTICTGISASDSATTKITASLLAFFNNYVTGVNVTGTGVGYTNGDPLIFSGGGGTGAKGYIITEGGPNPDGGTTQIDVNSGGIYRAIITNGGKGFTSAPSVAVTTSGGAGNTLTATVYSAVIPMLTIRRISFCVSSGGAVEVIFNGATPQTACILVGTGEFDFYAKGYGTLPNGATTPTGDISFTATGSPTYTVVMECQKVSGYGSPIPNTYNSATQQ